ncbi:hypothetical protein BJX99DRAFT_230387 [Aspergillus californicus]
MPWPICSLAERMTNPFPAIYLYINATTVYDTFCITRGAWKEISFLHLQWFERQRKFRFLQVSDFILYTALAVHEQRSEMSIFSRGTNASSYLVIRKRLLLLPRHVFKSSHLLRSSRYDRGIPRLIEGPGMAFAIRIHSTVGICRAPVTALRAVTPVQNCAPVQKQVAVTSP